MKLVEYIEELARKVIAEQAKDLLIFDAGEFWRASEWIDEAGGDDIEADVHLWSEDSGWAMVGDAPVVFLTVNRPIMPFEVKALQYALIRRKRRKEVKKGGNERKSDNSGVKQYSTGGSLAHGHEELANQDRCTRRGVT